MPFSRKYFNPDKICDALQKSKGRSESFISVSKGDFHAVRSMIKAGTDLNAREPNGGETLIYAAILSKNVRLIQELIDAGADVNLKINKPATPLTYAISEGIFEVVKVLLDNGADIFARIYSDEWTALHVSAYNGHVKISKLLIERGLEVDIRTKRNETPLHLAAKSVKSDIVQLLIAKGADISATCTPLKRKEDETKFGSNVTPVFFAVYWGRLDTVDFLIKAGADVNVKTGENLYTLLFAAYYGPIKLVNTLLKAGAGINVNVRSNYKGYTPLLLAAKSGHADIVKALLKVEGIEVDLAAETMETPLAVAAQNGLLEVVKLLEAKGASVNGCASHTTTPLHMALGAIKNDVAEFLIERGADIHAVNSDNATPLHVACAKASPRIVGSLVEKGVNVNARMKDGTTPLHYAARADCPEIIELLIDHGADCNPAGKEKFTPLHYAVSYGHVKTIAYLITKVSDVDVKSASLVTPLHCAVKRGYQEAAEVLLKSGADVNAQDDAKHTPLHIAVEGGDLKFAERLSKNDKAVASLNLMDPQEKCTPLVIKNKHVKLVSLLLDEGADVNAANKFGVLPIHVAVKAESVDIVKILLAKGSYYNVKVEAENYSGSPLDFARKAGNAKLVVIFELIRKLFSAVVKNNTDQIERCVQAGTIVNARKASGRTALHFVVMNYNAKAVKALLTGGADILLGTNKGVLPLQIAIGNGCITIPEILVEHARNLSLVKFNYLINAKIMKSGGTVLHTAAEKNKLHIVKFLLRSGAVYNVKNDSGKTPLELTATDDGIKSLLILAEKLFELVKKKSSSEAVKQILENDNSVINAREAASGGTPLYWSISFDHTDIALALLSNDADYCLVTNNGTTPLHIAASRGNVEIVKVLLNRVKIDNAVKSNEFINAATTNGTVALHVASNLDIVKCLLQAGATFDIRNGEDKTALELTQNEDVQRFLKTTHQIFKAVENGISIIMNVLNGLKRDEFKAVTYTRNEQGQTLVQVALANAHKEIASKLLNKLK